MNFSILAGSGSENLNEKGSAHMLAVSAFGGTAKRSGLRIVRDLENIGAKFTATADREKVTFLFILLCTINNLIYLLLQDFDRSISTC
jgi:predicted Zn-dependent peptidase